MKQKLLIAFLAIILILVGAYNWIFFSQRHKVKTGGEEPGAFIEDTMPSDNRASLNGSREGDSKIVTSKTGLPEQRKKISKIMNKKWGRNPFVSQAEVKSLLAIENKKKQEELPERKEAIKDLLPVTVSAILIGKDRKVAVVNHKIVTEGDWLEGEKIVRIKREEVVLGRMGKYRTIGIEKNSDFMVSFKKDRYVIVHRKNVGR